MDTGTLYPVEKPGTVGRGPGMETELEIIAPEPAAVGARHLMQAVPKRMAPT